ncbi:Alpha-1,2-mannosyltransferase [Penicillium ucsense]|uniref:Alpha-1,2-mannosyltransferase n=1 Tax=Penicillium ucsense TaxID=2839758 RepID=A0A8J8W5D9_9EURO|nr:Alpha-1,2-mannosyltransferase [Penicillium ucsense]KAF7737716.1 Alpha-1,2-mannosyltransferase [Penicillium ucsense]
MSFVRAIRRGRLSVVLSVAALSVWFLTSRFDLVQRVSRIDETPTEYSYNINEHIGFWTEFQPLLLAFEPQCRPPRRLGDATATRFSMSEPVPRPELLKMSSREVLHMKSAHSDFVNAINTNPPQLNYTEGTRGLVTTAGGAYLPVLVISLRMLRRTGSKLPVEVFLATHEEYEEKICDKVLPSLDAKCIVMTDILDAVPGIVKIEKYQLKPFAMLFSSFEEILFLDADAFPLSRPESIFENEPFKSTKMVTWPDFWASSASPLYYEISSQDVEPTTIRQSTESGELLISKRSHLKTLLLSTYYNFWGPSHYYRLFSQGASGEGDKETFVSAAAALGEPFYQVSEPLCAMGHRTEGGLAGSAMVQFNPREDYRLTQGGQWRVNGSQAAAPSAFFIHANFPKFNPATIFLNMSNVKPVFNDDGSFTRAWTIPEETIESFGRDVEKQFWADIIWTACELETEFESWRDTQGICEGVKKYWESQFGSENPAEA